MSKPRPIHSLHRDLRKQPDPAEPSFSYEKESFLKVDREEQFADEFHRRLDGAHNNLNSSGGHNSSFRRLENSSASAKSNNRINSSNSGTVNNGSGVSQITSSTGGKGLLTRSFPGLSIGNKNNGNSSSFWRSNSAVVQPATDESFTVANSSVPSAKIGENPKSFSKARSLLSSALENVDGKPQNSNGNVDEINAYNKGRSTSFDSSENHQIESVGLGAIDSSVRGGARDARKKKDIDKQRLEERRRKALEFNTNSFGLNDDDDNDDDYLDNDDKGVHPTYSPGSQAEGKVERKMHLSSASMDGIPTSVVVPASSASTAAGSFSFSGAEGVASLGVKAPVIPPPSSFPRHPGSATLDRSSSDQSTGSLLYCKTPNSTGLFGKSASLIFPTGVDPSSNKGNTQLNVGTVEEDNTEEATKIRRAKIEMALDQCETVRFPFKKKLILHNLKMRASDIPLQELCGTSLGNSLHKLTLSGNRFGTIPARLVQNLPVLKSLDLSQSHLNSLPDKWHLPKLTKLNLSNNRFTDFPEEVSLPLF